MKLAIIVTAKGLPRNLDDLCRIAGGQEGMTVVVALDDWNDPAALRQACFDAGSKHGANLVALTPNTIAVEGACPIRMRSNQRRTVGIAWAVEEGFDLVWLVDDDNFSDPPVLNQLRDCFALQSWPRMVARSRSGVLDQYCAFRPSRARGTPRVGWTSSIEAGLSDPIRPAVVQGWCAGDLDVDAPDRWLRPVKRYDPGREEEMIRFGCGLCLLLSRTWTPLNAQNTILTREAAKAYWYPYIEPQGPLGASRLDDILAGWLLQAVLEVRGERTAIGGPVLVQDRNDHDIYDDIEQEAYGYRLNEYVYGFCREWAKGKAEEAGMREKPHADLLGVLAEDLASQAWLARRDHIVRWVEQLGREAGTWAAWWTR